MGEIRSYFKLGAKILHVSALKKGDIIMIDYKHNRSFYSFRIIYVVLNIGSKSIKIRKISPNNNLLIGSGKIIKITYHTSYYFSVLGNINSYTVEDWFKDIENKSFIELK